MAAKLLMITFTMIFTENYVLVKFLGICPFLGVSKKLDSCLGMTGAVTFVMTLASAATWAIYTYIMVPLGLDYLTTIIFILVIAALVQFVEIVLKKYMKGLYNALGIYLPLITTNCAVLAVTIMNVENHYNLFESVCNGVFGALGFMLAIVLMAGVRERLETSDIPKSFKGFPSSLITAGLMSIAFMGFQGLVK